MELTSQLVRCPDPSRLRPFADHRQIIPAQAVFYRTRRSLTTTFCDSDPDRCLRLPREKSGPTRRKPPIKQRSDPFSPKGPLSPPVSRGGDGTPTSQPPRSLARTRHNLAIAPNCRISGHAPRHPTSPRSRRCILRHCEEKHIHWKKRERSRPHHDRTRRWLVLSHELD